MSKTFSNTSGNRDIRVIDSSERGFIIRAIDHAGARSVAVTFNNDTAPALALAILEAAGYEDSSTGGHITGARIAVGDLKRHVKMQERATAEAEAQAKLEAEALELCNAWREANGYDALSSFSDGAPIGAMAEWLAVARCAREMAKEATK